MILAVEPLAVFVSFLAALGLVGALVGLFALTQAILGPGERLEKRDADP